MVSGAGGQLETGMGTQRGLSVQGQPNLSPQGSGVYSLYTAGKYNEDMIGRGEDSVAEQDSSGGELGEGERERGRRRENGINAHPQTD